MKFLQLFLNTREDKNATSTFAKNYYDYGAYSGYGGSYGYAGYGYAASYYGQGRVSSTEVSITLLDVAAEYGQLNITKWYKNVLGVSNINPKDKYGNTPLARASYLGHLEIAKYYIENGYIPSGKVYN